MNDTDDFLVIRDEYGSFKCSYCDKFISLMPLTIGDNKFCDMICAKLYCNDHGIKSIYYNKKQYDEFYRNGLLTPLAMTTYTYLQKVPFELFPRTLNPENNHAEYKQKYLLALSNYISQMM